MTNFTVGGFAPMSPRISSPMHPSAGGEGELGGDVSGVWGREVIRPTLAEDLPSWPGPDGAQPMKTEPSPGHCSWWQPGVVTAVPGLWCSFPEEAPKPVRGGGWGGVEGVQQVKRGWRLLLSPGTACEGRA